MNNSIHDFVLDKIKNQSSNSSESNKTEVTDKKHPHLALCHETNKSANNRHTSLLMKSKNVGKVDLIKSEDEAREFEAFCKTLSDPHVLLDLFLFCKSSGEDDFIQSVIDNNKEY
ncbi:hypothetical protein ACKC5O_12525 [Aeromonas schubertii]|uniref:hypothetical protein n=1 Tax=Aeromonas schubertii TaxID=652 RepID=UPI0038B4B573